MKVGEVPLLELRFLSHIWVISLWVLWPNTEEKSNVPTQLSDFVQKQCASECKRISRRRQISVRKEKQSPAGNESDSAETLNTNLIHF